MLKKCDEAENKLDRLEDAKDKALRIAHDKVMDKYRRPQAKLTAVFSKYADSKQSLTKQIISDCLAIGIDSMTIATLLKRTADAQ